MRLSRFGWSSLAVLALAQAAFGAPQHYAALELDEGDESLVHAKSLGGSAEPVQTDNEETAWWAGFSPEGDLFYAEGDRLRMDVSAETTPVLATGLDHDAPVPATIGPQGRVAYVTPNDVILAHWDAAAKVLKDARPVFMPPRCHGRDLRFSDDGATLFVLCRTPAPTTTWLVRVEVENGRGPHVFAKDVERILGVGTGDDGPILQRRSEEREAAITVDAKGAPRVLYAGKYGETMLGYFRKHGEVVVAAPSAKGRALKAVAFNKGTERTLGRAINFTDADVSERFGDMVLTVPSPGGDGKGDVVLVTAGGEQRKLLHGNSGKQRYFFKPVLQN